MMDNKSSICYNKSKDNKGYKISKEQQEKVDRIKKFASRGEIYKRFDNLTSGQIKEKKSIEQYGEK